MRYYGMLPWIRGWNAAQPGTSPGSSSDTRESISILEIQSSYFKKIICHIDDTLPETVGWVAIQNHTSACEGGVHCDNHVTPTNKGYGSCVHNPYGLQRVSYLESRIYRTHGCPSRPHPNPWGGYKPWWSCDSDMPQMWDVRQYQGLPQRKGTNTFAHNPYD